MGVLTVGRVLIEAKVENLGDLWEARNGRLADGAVRRITLVDALVDAGATTLSLPARMVRELGLEARYRKKITTSGGQGTAAVYDPVRLTIQERDCSVDVLEVPDTVPALIGQIPLEMLDLVVDLRNRRLIGNPEHGGEHIIELYLAQCLQTGPPPRRALGHFSDRPERDVPGDFTATARAVHLGLADGATTSPKG